MKIKIEKIWVGDQYPTFIIAEAGINHNGRVNIAKKLIQKAVDVRANAIKFQTFKSDDLVSMSSDHYKFFKKLELQDSEFEELSDYSKSLGLIFLSTPFSESSANLLKTLKVPAFKIASGDLTHLPLIKHVAKIQKPIIISTGMGTIKEIRNAIRTIESTGNKKIIILHSTSSYPTPICECNLLAINQFEKLFRYPIGYSDNGGDKLVPIIASAIGAKIIEKHFTLSRKLQGPDHVNSFDPKEFRDMVESIRKVEQMLGDGEKKCQSSEYLNKENARRSITAIKKIEKGTMISKNMIKILRPAKGITPSYLDTLIGKKVKKTINTGDSVVWNHIINNEKN